MVEGSLSDDERDAWNRVVGFGFVLLVGGSAGLIALQGGASPVEIAGVSAFGLALGAGLVWYLASLRRGNSRRRR